MAEDCARTLGESFLRDHNERDVLMLCPGRPYAARHAKGELERLRPTSIALDAFSIAGSRECTGRGARGATITTHNSVALSSSRWNSLGSFENHEVAPCDSGPAGLRLPGEEYRSAP